MKPLYILVSLALLFCCHDSNCQTKANIGIGYNIGTHVKTDGLGFVIGRYNDTRTYLTTKMKEPRFFRGMNLALDFFYPKCLLDFEWIGRKSDVMAEDTQSNTRRDFRYKVSSFNFGFGIKMNNKKSGVMGSYLGIDFNMISIKNYTRVYQIGGDKDGYRKINSEFAAGFSPFLQFVGNRFTTKLYYQFMLNKVNYWDVNRAINPKTWPLDEFDSNKGRSSSLGICLRFNLLKNKD